MLGGPRGRVSVSAFPLALLAVVLPACCTITGVGVVVMNSGQRRGGIFISYRREETAGQAGRLYDRLSGRFGAGRVFMDVDSIAIGVDFTTAITEAVSGCDILLALIGREWLTLTDSRGQRRLDDPDDFVRVEIEAALQRDIRVVPVLVEGAVLPQAADLPTSLRMLVRRQALMLSHVGFGAEVSRLIAAVDAVLGAGPGRAADADRDTDRVAAKTGPPAGKQHAGLPVKEEQPDMARARGAPSGLEAADDPAYVDGLSALLAGRFDEAADCFTALQDRYQLTHADLPAEFPPIRTAAERTGNLPVPVSSFIGRARELEQTGAALGQARVVTLTGPGGVGKTRLAVQAATQVAPRFDDGAWLCELAPVRDPAGVDDAVAAVFSLTARAGQSTRDALAEFLRPKELLLVLDNCEHLLDGAAAVAGALARSCERLVLLATSREALGIDGERLVPVPPLGVPGADADLAAITEAEAVRLFAERAAAVKPGFQVTAGNAAAVTAVVRRLDGIPLAVELAAARVPAMTPAELAQRLERSFAVLAGGRRDAVAQHQTLRAAIDWSFQLLTGPEQVLLGRLAVFAGGCTLEAVEAVCGGEGIDPDAVLELLAGLVARSLVAAGEHGPQTRYRLLETIRQYGEQRLEAAGETKRWRARHPSDNADHQGRVRAHAHHPNPEVFWSVRLSAEQDNLLAAWSWAIGTGNIGTAFQMLAGFAPCEVWLTYPLLLPGEAALELPGAAGHPGYPLALAVSAVFASYRADVTGAEELCRQAAEANARQATPGRGDRLRRPPEHRDHPRRVRRRRPPRRTGRPHRAERR